MKVQIQNSEVHHNYPALMFFPWQSWKGNIRKFLMQLDFVSILVEPLEGIDCVVLNQWVGFFFSSNLATLRYVDGEMWELNTHLKVIKLEKHWLDHQFFRNIDS